MDDPGNRAKTCNVLKFLGLIPSREPCFPIKLTLFTQQARVLSAQLPEHLFAPDIPRRTGKGQARRFCVGQLTYPQLRQKGSGTGNALHLLGTETLASSRYPPSVLRPTAI
ncbi:hypothetical protein BaRGS_00024056 [Batillaria attramentaria]|uniref:Uncharacterized protein n=1 Tax=Batillaria attramentaria TaxID=370345 RepID=A0ABD0KC16_9CAEN